MFQRPSKLILRIFLFTFLCTTSSLTPTIYAAEIPTPVAPQNKALQTRVLTLLETFSISLHKIGIRVSSLNISPELLEQLKAEFATIQEDLKTIKATHSLHVTHRQLERLVVILNALIKGTEKALKKSFTVMIEPDPQDYTRGQNPIAPEELEQLLRTNEKRLRNFDRLILNMNKTTFNRSYSWLSDQWNEPIFSITSLGGESNKDIYISSILKRVGIYGGALSLVVYNLPQEYINKIPNTFLRKSVNWFKGVVGSADHKGTTSTTTKGVPVENSLPKEWVLGNPDGVSTTDLLQKIKTENGFPLITQGDSTEVIELVFNKQQQLVMKPQGGGLLGFTNAIAPETEFKLHLKNGCTASFTYGNSDTFLKRLNYDGMLLELPSGGYAQQYAPDKFRDLATQEPLQISEEALSQAQLTTMKKIVGSDYYDLDGSPICPEQIRGRKLRRFATETRNEQGKDHVSSDGVINKLFGNVSWLLNPDLKLGFSLPVAPLLAAQVYEDFTILKKDIPQVCAYLHSKLRGEHHKVTSQYELPKTTFDDVIGREELKQQLQPIINFVSNPESFIQAGIQVPRGILLAGEPQTGKTSLVSAFAGELSKKIRETQGPGKDVKLFPIDVHYLLKYGIGSCMEILREHAPCILFCDEFDLTGAQRNENKAFLAEALTALSGYATSSDLRELVIFVIATNRPENIDYAILQNGRCGTILYFENPYYKDRKAYFEHFFKTKVIDPNAFDLDLLAQETEACSYGTLQTIAHGIMSTADKYNKLPNQTHADEVLDTVVRKIIYDDAQVPESKRETLAARYGAKAFASVALNPDKKFVAATISKITEEIKEKHVLHHYDVVNDKEVTGIRYGGIFSYNLSDTYGLVSNNERLKECKIALAGTVGQRILDLDYTSYPEDEMQALKIARRIVFNGCDERLYPRKVREEKSIEAYLLVEKCRQEMYDLLEQNRDNYEKLVSLLQRRRVIRTSDIKQCFDLADLDLVEDYFSKLPEEASLKNAFVQDKTSEEELAILEEEELEQQEKAEQAQREKEYQSIMQRKLEAAQAAEREKK